MIEECEMLFENFKLFKFLSKIFLRSIFSSLFSFIKEKFEPTKPIELSELNCSRHFRSLSVCEISSASCIAMRFELHFLSQNLKPLFFPIFYLRKKPYSFIFKFFNNFFAIIC